jgi:transposase
MKDESLENNVVTLHARGWSIRKLAREFGISRGRVGRILLRNQFKRETGSEYRKESEKKPSKLDQYKEAIF